MNEKPGVVSVWSFINLVMRTCEIVTNTSSVLYNYVQFRHKEF